MASKNKYLESYFQKKITSAIILFSLCSCICQVAFPSSYESASTDYTITANPRGATSVTLKVSVVSPQDKSELTNFPSHLEVMVTRGGYPVQGARVQFWMMGGSHDTQMHNVFSTMTDSSGHARLTLLSQNTLDQGPYIWYADATMPGFRGGASTVISFINPFGNTNGILTSGGTVSTNQNVYSRSVNGASVTIHGNVNNYHWGEPIIIKIKSPSGKTLQMVEYGTYLGSFQSTYNLGQNAELGRYSVIVTHNYFASATSGFYVVK
ncbi:MAG TPA: hypothetical protein VFP45_03040 [Candidatus Nitrosotalea sp.]|nr:hypothetical protein [Candidatus Nitrosotalea sp.]